MADTFDGYQQLFDKNGQFLGVFISAEMWEQIADQMQSILKEKVGVKEEIPEKPEPVADWEMLKMYWDFQYPENAEVCCDECGSKTDDWEKDEEKKFYLKAANIGGLVRFKCMNCQSLITKRHFKDHMVYECKACKLEE